MTWREERTRIECCSIFKDQGFLRNESVLQTQRVHLFPFRTQKLSSAVAKILYGRLYGKIAQCWHRDGGWRKLLPLSLKKWRKLQTILYGGVAQLGEHLPCKQGVMGSNPIISTKGRKSQKKRDARPLMKMKALSARWVLKFVRTWRVICESKLLYESPSSPPPSVNETLP